MITGADTIEVSYQSSENVLDELKPVVEQAKAESDVLRNIYDKILITSKKKLRSFVKTFDRSNDMTRPIIRYIKDKANAFIEEKHDEIPFGEVARIASEIINQMEKLKKSKNVKSEAKLVRDALDNLSALSRLPFFGNFLKGDTLIQSPQKTLERLTTIAAKSLLPDLLRIKMNSKNKKNFQRWTRVASVLNYYLQLKTKRELSKKKLPRQIRNELKALERFAKEARNNLRRLEKSKGKKRVKALNTLKKDIDNLETFLQKNAAPTTTAPDIGRTTAQPDGGQTTAQSGGSSTTVQSGDAQTTTESGGGQTTAQPGGGQTTAQSGDGQTTAQSGDGQTTAQSGDGQTTAQSGDGQTTAQSGDGQTTAQSGDGQTTAQSGDGQTTAQSGDGQTTSPSGEEIDPTTGLNLPDDLPTLDEFSKFKSFEFTKELALTDDCSVSLSSDGCIISTIPNPDDCLTVTVIIEKVLNTISGITEALQIGSVGGNPIDLSDLVVKYFEVNVCDETVTLSVALFADRKITIIPSALSVTNIEIDLTILIPTKSISVSFSATWDLGGVAFTIQASYDSGEYEIIARPLSSDLSLAKLLGSVTNAVVPGDSTSASSLFNELKLNDITISDVSLVAKFTDSGIGVQFSFTATVSGLGSTAIMLNFNRLREGGDYDNGFSLAALLKDLTLASIIQHIANYDISSVPLIGSLEFPEVALIGASKDIPMLIVDYNSESDVMSLLPSVAKGVTILFSARLDGNSDPMNFMVTYTPPRSIGFKILPGPQVDIESILNTLLDSINIQLPPGFPLASFLNQGLSNMNFNGEVNELSFPVVIEDDITIVENVFEIEEPQVEFVIGLGKPKTLSFVASGTWMIRDYPIELTISKPPGGSEFLASACSDRPLQVGKVMAKLASSFLPDFVADAFETFSIDDPCIEVLIGKNFGMRVSGTAVIGSFDASKVEVLGGKVDGAMLMALGVVLEKTKLSSVIDKLTNGEIDISSMPGSRIFDESSIGFVTSTHEIPSIGRSDLKFRLAMLDDTNILDGVSLVAQIKLPQDCSGDIVCGVFKKFFGADFSLIIKGRLAINDLLLEVTIPTEITIAEGFTLSGLGFRVIVRPPMIEVALVASLVIDDPALSFSGAIGFSTTGGATLEMAMVGCWVKPFTIPILTICDLYIKIGITPEPTLISELHLGGRGQIGMIGNPKARLFNASLFIGLNKIVPSESYFMGEISSLTIPDVLAAFAYFPSLPKALEEIGFPDGLAISYSQFGKMLPNGVNIPSGFRFNGTLQILDFRVSSTMRLDINGIYILVMVDRFNIGNDLISIDGDGKYGPELLVDVGWNPPRAKIDIMGRVCVLKICASVNITIDSRGIYFEIGGSFLSLFEAQLTITANYASLATAKFSVAGYFKQTLLENLKNKVTGAISDLSKEATAAFDAAKRELDSAKGELKDAADDLREKKSDVDRIQNSINSKAEEIGNQKAKVDVLERKWKESVEKARREVGKLDAAKKEITNLQNKIKNGESVCPSGCRRRRKRDISHDRRSILNGHFMKASLRDVRLDGKTSKSFLNPSRKRVIKVVLANGMITRDKRFLLDNIEEGRETVEDGIEIGKEKTREAAEDVRETAEDAKEITKEKAREVAERTREAAEKTKGLQHVQRRTLQEIRVWRLSKH
ncbi:unnamed protein product [Owenia fusiformis]|uniref:Uncharacterized protein n=1 Tax=Owenia fusiformis TaxID=6347 RepID=A0A8S4PWR2_OWEFU|nr:unnamed protein product [Owenia fusiformis]